MISNTLFITYTIMCFLSLQAITLVVMVIRHNDTGSTRLLKATRDFVITSIILGLFYYVTYYQEMVLGNFENDVFSRGLDGMIFYLTGWTWIRLVDAISDSSNPRLNPWRKCTGKVFFVLMILAAFIYIFILDEYYTMDTQWKEIVVVAQEAVLSLTVIVFTLAYTILSFADLPDQNSRTYVVLIGVLINVNNVWNSIVACYVFVGRATLGAIFSNLCGATSILLLIIHFLTLIYVYKKDFSPFFFGKKTDQPKPRSEQEVLDLIAETHRLTERERDVFLLAYQGLTNPDIAEKLFISRHTVKRHMHNIFEKLDVSTRMEMLHLIQTQMSSDSSN